MRTFSFLCFLSMVLLAGCDGDHISAKREGLIPVNNKPPKAFRLEVEHAQAEEAVSPQN